MHPARRNPALALLEFPTPPRLGRYGMEAASFIARQLFWEALRRDTFLLHLLNSPNRS